MNALCESPFVSLPRCPRSLTNDHKRQFREDGYLTFSDVLSEADVVEAREALAALTHDLVTDPHKDYIPPQPASKMNTEGARSSRRGGRTAMHLEANYDPAGRPLAEIATKVRKYWSFSGEAEVFPRMLGAGSALRAVVEGLLGPDPLPFQEMALVKPPFIGSEKPWH